MDGEITALQLFNKLDNHNAVYNPKVDENSLENHIKLSLLKKKAVETGIVEAVKIPLGRMLSLILTFLCTIIPVLIDMISAFSGDNNIFKTLNFSGRAGIILYTVCPLMFIGVACWIYFEYRKNNIEFIGRLKKYLKESDDNKYFNFINMFQADDFQIPDCNPGKNIFVCSFESYNHRQKYILSLYHKAVGSKQLWWIFLRKNADDSEADFMMTNDSKKRVTHYELISLSAKDKKKIASVAYANHTKFKPEFDAGLKLFGVDYIFRHQLKNKISSEETGIDHNIIKEKKEEFCRAHGTGNNVAIRLVAELACVYKIDFYDKKWQLLFGGTYGNEALNKLDDALSDELNLDNKTMKNLIPEIVLYFNDYFEEILASDTSNSAKLDLYDQWCIVKALKACSNPDEQRFIAIADALMNEFESSADNPEDSKDQWWGAVAIQTASVFLNNRQFWFLPMLIHNLLEFYKGNNDYSNKIFSSKTVLDVARANLLLSFNTSAEKDAYFEIDLVKEHYQVVCRVLYEQKSESVINRNTTVPVFLDILRLNKTQRHQYYNALVHLGEKDVLLYYKYMFDMFCAEMEIRGSGIRFFINRTYTDKLYEEYGNAVNDDGSLANAHIKLILKRLLNLLKNLYKGISSVDDGIENLNQLLSSANNTQTLHAGLFLIARLDIIGADTLSFIACLITRIISDDALTEDVYLNFGNYLLGLMFLTYHENSFKNYFNNDFLHLVSICISYEEPGEAMLGFLSYCDSMVKPKTSEQYISNYIFTHKEQLFLNLHNVIDGIGLNLIEDFFSYCHCTGRYLNDEEKKEIYRHLRNKVREKFSDAKNFALLDELLTLYIDDCSTDEFKRSTPEENVKKVLSGNDDTVYLIFDKYFDFFRDQYFEFFPDVVSRIINCDLSNRWQIVILYVKECDNIESEQYVSTCKILYESFKRKVDEIYDISHIEEMIIIILAMLKRKEKTPDLYTWLNQNESEIFAAKLLNTKSRIMLIQAKEYLDHRKVINYGT